MSERDYTTLTGIINHNGMRKKSFSNVWCEYLIF